MTRSEIGIERESTNELAFSHYLRTGQRFTSTEWESKFNPNHDPQNGQFTFGYGGSPANSTRIGKESPNRINVSRASSPTPIPTPPRAPLTADHIRSIMPRAERRADGFADSLDRAMRANGISTLEQQAAFLAQISVESGDLRHTSEVLDYSAKRLMEVWPDRFPTIEVAKRFAHNPIALANRVYADRLGNGDVSSGDGFKYRGRGLMQITGRENYRRAGFEKNPDALAEPQNAANSAATFWKSQKLHTKTSAVLSRSQFDAISRTVNGGNHGSDERWAAYQRALLALRPRPSRR